MVMTSTAVRHPKIEQSCIVSITRHCCKVGVESSSREIKITNCKLRSDERSDENKLYDLGQNKSECLCVLRVSFYRVVKVQWARFYLNRID